MEWQRVGCEWDSATDTSLSVLKQSRLRRHVCSHNIPVLNTQHGPSTCHMEYHTAVKRREALEYTVDTVH